MQTAAINIRTQAPVAAKSRATEELSQEFSELLNALDNSADSSASSGSTDAEMVNILADQLSTTVISQATAQQLNQKQKTEEKKDTPKTESEGSANQNFEVSEENTSENNQNDNSAKIAKPENAEKMQSQARTAPQSTKQMKPSVESVANDVAPVQTQKVEGNSPVSAVADNQISTSHEAELPAAEIAVRNIMNAQPQNAAALTPARADAPAQSVAPQMANMAVEARAAKVQPSNNTDNVKAEFLNKAKEINPRAEEGKASKSHGKKDFQLSVQKIEDALKEAVAAKDGKSISIKLEPSALGAVKVDVTLKDGGLYARVVVESPQVGNMMRERTQEIVENLKKLGLNVDSINVFIGNNSQGNDFREQLPMPAKNAAQSLRVLMNDASALDAKTLAPGLRLGKDLNSGWIA